MVAHGPFMGRGIFWLRVPGGDESWVDQSLGVFNLAEALPRPGGRSRFRVSVGNFRFVGHWRLLGLFKRAIVVFVCQWPLSG